MLSLHSGNRYLLYQGWADARKSFDGLSGIVTNEMELPLQTGVISNENCIIFGNQE